MSQLNRTAIDSEKQFRDIREKNDVKFCKEEIFSAVGHLLISFEKLIDSLNDEEKLKNYQHIDNVYYHIGKIKGLI